eukprot:m.38748 g.38748  ORF g.38748 m.38748 type:complete len:761 (+) comp9471_c1_seq1:206-2488(+)
MFSSHVSLVLGVLAFKSNWVSSDEANMNMNVYIQHAREYWPTGTKKIEECIRYQQAGGLNFSTETRKFRTFGIERSGTGFLDDAPTIFKDFIGFRSFPLGYEGHTNLGAMPFIPNITEEEAANEKYIFLAREPMDTVVLALEKFWRVPTVETLIYELQGYMYAYRRLHQVVQRFLCGRTLFIGFEKFMENPTAYKDLLAGILAVEKTNPELESYLKEKAARVANQQTKCSHQLNCTRGSSMYWLCSKLKRYIKSEPDPKEKTMAQLKFCKKTDSEETCYGNIREVVYNITRDLQPHFPELLPDAAITGCPKEFGKDVFARLEVNYEELMYRITANYPHLKGKHAPPIVWNTTHYSNKWGHSEPIVVKHSRVADIPQNYSGDMLKVFLNKERTIRNLHDLWTFLHFVATNENPIDLTRTAVVLSTEKDYNDERGCILDIWNFFIKTPNGDRVQVKTWCQSDIIKHASEECYPGCPFIDSKKYYSNPITWRTVEGTLDFFAVQKNILKGKHWYDKYRQDRHTLKIAPEKMRFDPGTDRCAIVNHYAMQDMCRNSGISNEMTLFTPRVPKEEQDLLHTCMIPEVKEISAKMALRMFTKWGKGKKAKSISCFHCIHWRRGDKLPDCRSRSKHKYVACGGADDLIALAKSLKPEGLPVYISTNERDKRVRKQLSAAGLFLMEDVLDADKEIPLELQNWEGTYAVELQLQLWACYMHQFRFPWNSLVQLMPYLRTSENDFCCKDRKCVKGVKFETADWESKPHIHE